jgi:erythromycin esterase-like protein
VLRTRRTRQRKSQQPSLPPGVARLTGDPSDYDALLTLIGDARVVLIGEASHGTHEFYAERAAITRRLILERDFGAVCIEGDWPDTHRVDCWVKGRGEDASAEAALDGFKRFPTWMWRNEVVRDFIGWLRSFNDAQEDRRKVGFYGLDLYSLFGSIDAVLSYLRRVDPEAAERARLRYSCFGHFGEDSQAYGYAVSRELVEPCERDAITQLLEVRAKAMDYRSRDGRPAFDEFFSAEQNARLVIEAERYYRTMFAGRASSWNLRDRHMMDTLEAVHRHLSNTGRSAKLVVWAHNSHLGDARFTDMRRRGELNLGQLVREKYGDTARLIGFSTSIGSVTAAHDWDEPAHRMRVRPPLEGSYERMFATLSSESGVDRYLIPLRDGAMREELGAPRLQRAIGVIYRPETELASHYYRAELTKQFDAHIHIDTTSALRALEPDETWDRDFDEPPETFPSGV